MKHILNSGFIILVLFVMGFSCENQTGNPSDDDQPVDDVVIPLEIPRIDFVSLSEEQPQESDENTIWFDDFDEIKTYMESSGELDTENHYGTSGSSMKAGFAKGAVNGEGNRKLAFGDFPNTSVKVRDSEQFDEVYWRIYVKHEHGWYGSPAKMSRATSIVSSSWQQAMILHVWSGSNNSLTLDPARGVSDQTNIIATTKYNDFDNLVWIGNKPESTFLISATNEAGCWVMVEAMVKLNSPGQSDGISKLWINGKLEAERSNMNLRGSYTSHGVNAVFLESYWNSGSPKTQGRWYDNFIVSTEPIGPVSCPANPVLYKVPYFGPEKLEAWEVDLAADQNGLDIVYSASITSTTENVFVNTDNGTFSGSLSGQSSLSSGQIYFCRVRQKSTNGEWSEWSDWHQPFRVE